MLHTKIQPEAFLVLEKKIFLVFLLYMDMAAILIYGPLPFSTIFNPPFNRRLYIKFGEICSGGFRVEVVQRCERTDGRRTGSDHNSSS